MEVQSEDKILKLVPKLEVEKKKVGQYLTECVADLVKEFTSITGYAITAWNDDGLHRVGFYVEEGSNLNPLDLGATVAKLIDHTMLTMKSQE